MKIGLKLGSAFGAVILITLGTVIIGYNAMGRVHSSSATGLAMNQIATETSRAMEEIQRYIASEEPQDFASALTGLSTSAQQVQTLLTGVDGEIRQHLADSQQTLRQVSEQFRHYRELVGQKQDATGQMDVLAAQLRDNVRYTGDALADLLRSRNREMSTSAFAEALAMVRLETSLAERIALVNLNVESYENTLDEEYINEAWEQLLEIFHVADSIQSWAQVHGTGVELQEQLDQAVERMRQYRHTLDMWTEAVYELRETASQFRTSLEAVNSSVNAALTATDIYMALEVARSGRMLIIGAILAVVTALTLALVSTVMIVRPLNTAAKFVHRVAEGDLSEHLELQRSDEIGDLTRSLNAMVNHLRQMVQGIRQAASDVASSSEELSSSSSHMSDGIAHHAGNISQIASASLQMSQTVRSLMENTSGIEQDAQTTVDASRGGGDLISQSTREMNTILEHVRQAEQYSLALEEKASRVEQIIAAINDISEQTNLLALNAAIEAARAGDVGRGFAVVADEVRKLAERSGQSTGEITAIVQSIQSGVSQMSGAMQSVSEKASTGSTLAVRTESSFKQVLLSMESLLQRIEQNVAAMEQMSAVSDQMSGDIQSVSAASEQTARSANEISQASLGLSQLASDVQQMLSQFRTGEEDNPRAPLLGSGKSH